MIVLAAVFVVFAVQLASNQNRTRSQIKTEVSDRAQLAASLIDTLFQTVQQQKVQYSIDYGRTINHDKLATAAQLEAYAVVTDAHGTVIASAGGYDPAAGLTLSTAFLSGLAAKQAPYYLGDEALVGGRTVADFVVPFPAAGGERLLVTGLSQAALEPFFSGELKTIPGVKGEHNYLVDGNGVVMAGSGGGVQTGTPISHPSSATLHRRAGDDHGNYFQVAPLANSGWRIVLVAPSSTLFSSVNGARAYVPWIIFFSLVVVALLAAGLGWRVLRSAEVVSEVNGRLAAVNAELSVVNESLHRRAAELARSNEELESFASIASHDLQEPLRKVRTFTEQLTILEAERLSDKGRDYLERANAAAERMQRLIEDLLKFSRVSTQGRPFERVDLAELADRVIYDLEAQIEDAGATFDIGPLPEISADPLQMQQLLQNLISNAIKFRQPDVPAVVKVRGQIEDGVFRLTVSDNGIGFEPRYAARIFRIFERLHGRTEYPGTGIGLALCRKIADRHGGTIEAESSPGNGATFVVRLPMDQPEGSFGFGISAVQGRSGEEVNAGARA